MKKRLDALSRIDRFQALMRDLGRSRLHLLELEQAGLTDDLKAVFETLESDELAYGPQAGLVARHIRALQRKLDQLLRDQEAARLSAGAQAMRAKLAAIALETAVLDHHAIRNARSWPSSSSGRSAAEAQARHKARGGRWFVPPRWFGRWLSILAQTSLWRSSAVVIGLAASAAAIAAQVGTDKVLAMREARSTASTGRTTETRKTHEINVPRIKYGAVKG